LKKSLGKLAASYISFRRWTNVFKNGREETNYAPRSGAPTSTTEERHMKNAKSVLESTHIITSTAIVTEDGISPASVYCILTNSSGKRKVCAKWITHVLNHDQTAMSFFFATTHPQRWRN
jgi:hypothetical protein